MKIDERLSFLSEERQRFLQKWILYLGESLDTLEYIVLFGSYARGEEKAASDMDIMVVTREVVSRTARGELCSVFDENNMDLIFYTLEQWKASDCLLVNRIQREGIVIWKRK
ncbi:MAG: polymerase beta, Nucleotidyltransferase [Clostridiales bacterium]|nr:polymerase beta, Nucleotidyltransferase [Clostridiales bacterium]